MFNKLLIVSYVYGRVYFPFALCIVACRRIAFVWWGSHLHCSVRMSDVYSCVFHNVFLTEGIAFLTREGWIKENLVQISCFTLYYLRFKDRLPATPPGPATVRHLSFKWN